MDNCFFPLADKHLRRGKPCAPPGVCAVTPTGTKPAHRRSLWISRHLCQSYPQSYATPSVWKTFCTKNASSARSISASSSFFNSKSHTSWRGGGCIPGADAWPSAHAIPAHNLFKVFERPHQGPWRAPGEGMGCPGLAAPLPQALRPGMAPVPPFWRARGPEERFAPPTPAPWPDLQPTEPAGGL